MKYFTPELFAKLQECESPDEFRAVNREWEIAAGKYNEHLKLILTKLDAPLRRFVQFGSFHDANIISISLSGRCLTLIIRQGNSTTEWSLRYGLVETPRINHTAIAEQHRAFPATWLYDELEVESTENDPVFVHSILLSNGWELAIRFRKFAFARATTLLRPSTNLSHQDLVSQTA